MLKDDPQLSDLDLDAYVDNQLTEAQKSEVEAYLAGHPDAAAGVMRDMAIGRDLRRALSPPPAPGPLRRDARRLSLAMRRDKKMRAALRLVPAGIFVAVGWLAHAGLGPLSISEGTASTPMPPPVTAALSAHQVSLLRLSLSSQPEVTDLDPRELRAATGILLPSYPADWKMRDAQVFPSPQGPGIEILFDSAELGRVSHFAVRAGSFGVTLPRLQDMPDQDVAWFQIGETVHVLVAEDDHAAPLLAASVRLSDTLY